MGQSVFCNPAQPVKTLVRTTKGNAVLMRLIRGSLLRVGVWPMHRKVKTSVGVCASIVTAPLGRKARAG